MLLLDTLMSLFYLYFFWSLFAWNTQIRQEYVAGKIKLSVVFFCRCYWDVYEMEELYNIGHSSFEPFKRLLGNFRKCLGLSWNKLQTFNQYFNKNALVAMGKILK